MATRSPASPGWAALLRADLPASLVVFLVALPLSLGIALASGAPVQSGLIAAAVGGIVVGLFGGAPLQVSGPAAGLVTLVAGTITQFGFATACLVTAIAGVIQIGLSFTRRARIALAMSPAVVHGMLAGIGVFIVIGQCLTVLGLRPGAEALENLETLAGSLGRVATPTFLVGAVTFAVLWGWTKAPAKLRLIPGALLAVVAGTLASLPFGARIGRIELPNDPLAGFQLPHLPGDGHHHYGPILVAAVTIAFVASIESLLSAVATDRMHPGPRANLDRELLGQGLANTVSGLIGGLPITGVIVRSSANVAAGARSRASAILHGVWILVTVFLLASVVELIPKSVLGGLLVFTGLRLVNVNEIRSLRKHREALPYFVTMVGVVLFGLLDGVLAGFAVAGVLLLLRLAPLRVEREDLPGGPRVTVRGSATNLTVPRLSAALAAVPPGRTVELHLATDFMDHAAYEAVHDWRHGYERAGGTVHIEDVHHQFFTQAQTDDPMHKKPVPESPLAGTPHRSALEGGL